MASLYGWKINHEGDVAVDFTADIEEGDLVTAAGAVCGSGGVAAGVASRDIDISEDGARGEYHTSGTMVSFVAAAVTDVTIPIKPAADGTVTPCTTDKDFYVGWPQQTQATVGGQVTFIWNPGYYAV